MSGNADVVLLERVGEHVAVVTLNRPEKRHAVNGALTARLDAIVKETERDPAIWVVVLAAAPSTTFCAGADLGEIAAGRAGELSTPDGGFGGFVESVRAKPWIAAVTGSALGGGLEFMLACDLRVIAQDTILGLPEVKRGLVAGAGGVYRLPRQIPRVIALEMIAVGDPIDATRAAELGLVNAVVPADQVLSKALDYAQRICANSPLAVRESFKIARKADEVPEAESIGAARQVFAYLVQTEDFAEGPRAFLEKRPPRWTGR